MDKAQFCEELVKALQENEEKLQHISKKQLTQQAAQKLQFDFPDVNQSELQALSDEVLQWLKSQKNDQIDNQQFPLQLTQTVLTNLKLGAKNSKFPDRSLIYRNICTEIYVGVVRYLLDNWDNVDSFQIIEKLTQNEVHEKCENFEAFVEFEEERNKDAESEDLDDFDYEDMNIDSNLDQNLNQNQKVDQKSIKTLVNSDQNRDLMNGENFTSDEKIKYKKQKFVLFCSFLDTSCIQLQIYQQQNQNQSEISYDYFSHEATEKIISQLCKFKIFEPVNQYIQLLAEFRPVLSQNVLNLMEILDQFEHGSILILQYLKQLLNLSSNSKIVALQWQNLTRPILIFIEKSFSNCAQKSRQQSDQNSDLIEQIYLCSQILKFWVDECKQLLGSCEVAEQLIQNGITTNLVQLFIKFGNQPQFEQIWFSTLVVISCGEKIVNYFQQVPKFCDIINDQIFRYDVGEGGTYGLLWRLIFYKEKEIIKNIIENSQNVQNTDQDQTPYRQFLSILRLLVVIKEISVEYFGEELNQCEKQMRLIKQSNELEELKIWDEVRTECLRYLKMLNSVPGKND
eukprot:TRINITY_DN3256_c0_g1_i1.p1 TRINITY_DN3256_c0_g1~~TRINITY_DN3256_c0_g1_i1.p1  ORF type:complete len:580 (-),score=44.90 TRINITY_DN3256_c0_g1_i1:116-1819(-)